MTMTLIEHYEVPSGGVTDIVFDEIPDTFTDLLIKVSLRNNRSALFAETTIGFNNLATNATVRYLGGDGSSPFSGTGTNGFFAVANGNTTTANTFANQEIYIPNSSQICSE